MSDYLLSKHGDPFEKLFAPYLHDRFPNYELFWRRFIVPLTGRSQGGGLQIRPKVDPLLEEMAMAHYSTYWHMGFSDHLDTTAGNVQFEAIFFHLGSAAEMVDRLLFILAKLDAKIRNREPFVGPLTKDAFSARVKEYWETRYLKDVERFKETGNSVRLVFHTSGEVVSRLCERIGPRCTEARSEWNKITGEISGYRNALIHNPRLGLVSNNDVPMVPKAVHLRKYPRWSQVLYGGRIDDFIPLDTCIRDCQEKLESATNRLWESLIEWIETFAQTAAYQALSASVIEDANEMGIAPEPSPKESERFQGDGFRPRDLPSGIGLSNPYTGGSGIWFPPPRFPGDQKH